MCEIPSWYEDEGKIWVATDKVISKYLRQNPEKTWEDMTGHSGLRLLCPEIPQEAKSGEGVNNDTPADIISSLERGEINKMLAVGQLVVRGDKCLSIPSATKVGTVWGYDDCKISLPKVTEVGEVWGYDTCEISLPLATEVGKVCGRDACKISLPKVTEVGKVWGYDTCLVRV